MLSLVPVKEERGAAKILYEWLRVRSTEDDPYTNISHRVLPTWQQHLRFVHSEPFRLWVLIANNHAPRNYLGYIYGSERNEIGIYLGKDHRGQGIGTRALELFISEHKPLPALPSRRRGCWLANINPANEPSIRMFERLGFKRIPQVTYALQGG